jgi:cyclophilin family peptidyl-prolyl cis-trans isomerase
MKKFIKWSLPLCAVAILALAVNFSQGSDSNRPAATTQAASATSAAATQPATSQPTTATTNRSAGIGQEKVMSQPAVPQKTVVVIETTMGTIKAELWPDKAPETVKNFLSYVEDKTYDGTIFHRVIPAFMIQGGGFTADMNQKPTHKPIKNEARSDTPNARGTLAMARTQVVDSATCQFFINHADNQFLNHTNNTPQGFGYCVSAR